MGVEHRCFFTHFSEAVHRLHRNLVFVPLSDLGLETVAGNSLELLQVTFWIFRVLITLHCKHRFSVVALIRQTGPPPLSCVPSLTQGFGHGLHLTLACQSFLPWCHHRSLWMIFSRRNVAFSFSTQLKSKGLNNCAWNSESGTGLEKQTDVCHALQC